MPQIISRSVFFNNIANSTWAWFIFNFIHKIPFKCLYITSAVTPVDISFHMRGKQEMGPELSTAFSLLWSFKHRIVLPKVSHSGSSSSLFKMLFNCSAILLRIPLSSF